MIKTTSTEAVTSNKSFIIGSLLIALALMIGLYFRLFHWSDWYFVSLEDGRQVPTLSNADGFFYLALARDWLEGIYHTSDTLRAFPDMPLRPDPIPLLSLLTAVITSILQLPVESVAAILPAFIGVLTAIPVAFIGYRIWGWQAATAASIFSVSIPYFVQRSNLGWYDTDSLILLLQLTASALAAWALSSTLKIRQYILFGLLYCATSYLFFASWDQAPGIVTLLILYPLFVLIFFSSKSWFRLLPYGVIIAIILAFSPITVKGVFVEAFSLSNYINAHVDSPFSPTAIAISEQQDIPFSYSSKETAGGYVGLFVATLGILFLAVHYHRFALLLLPFMVIGLYGYLLAERFLIFITPIISLGTASTIYLMTSQFTAIRRVAYSFLITGILASNLAYINLMQFREPAIPHEAILDMVKIAPKLPPDAVIWNLCDSGYALSYWLRRPTICDGSTHTGLRRTATAFPMFTQSEFIATRFIAFYLTYGPAGINKLLELTGNDWKTARSLISNLYSASAISQNQIPHQALTDRDDLENNFYPDFKRHVYLVIDRQTMRTTHWWYWFASWDGSLEKGISPTYVVLGDMDPVLESSEITGANQQYRIDAINGILKTSTRSYTLRNLNIKENGVWNEKNYITDEFWIVDYDKDRGFGVLHDPFTHEALGHRLFLNRGPFSNFRLIYDNGRHFQLWEVTIPQQSRGF